MRVMEQQEKLTALANQAASIALKAGSDEKRLLFEGDACNSKST